MGAGLDGRSDRVNVATGDEPAEEGGDAEAAPASEGDGEEAVSEEAVSEEASSTPAELAAKDVLAAYSLMGLFQVPPDAHT